jgi:D-erythro-7,8-dihydroneopterin triphosphate epimerase
MDRIIINDLSVRCIIGAWKEERKEKQDVLVNLVIGTDIANAVRTDNLDDALDYRALKKKVLNLVEGSSFNLLESLAEAIASLCLQDDKVREILVKVEKPSALRFAKSVGIEILRKKKDKYA